MFGCQGIQQKIFANKLGYSDEKIMTGFYSCDRELFHTYYKNNKDLKVRIIQKYFCLLVDMLKLKEFLIYGMHLQN